MTATTPEETLRRFHDFRGMLRRTHAAGLRLNDLSLMLTFWDHHPRPVHMAHILDLTGLARQTVNHHLRGLAGNVEKERESALVGLRRKQPVAHYRLTPAGLALCKSIILPASEP